MTAGNWIALAGVIMTGLGIAGGSGVIVWKGSAMLTRISATLVQVGKAMEALGQQVSAVSGQVQEHEARLTKGGL